MIRRAVSVLGIVVFHTCGYKSEAIVAFGASRNREKKGQNMKKTKEGKNLWQLTFGDAIFGKRFGYAELLATSKVCEYQYSCCSSYSVSRFRFFVIRSAHVSCKFLNRFIFKLRLCTYFVDLKLISA